MAERVILLTGAGGLVGSWLRKTVRLGLELVSLTHLTVVDGERTVSADLRDASATRAAMESVAPSMVIHAAMAVDARSIVDATGHVVEAAAMVGAEVLYVSTDAVFSGDARPVNEDAIPDPIWDYGRWKTAAESLVGAGNSVVAGQAAFRYSLISPLQRADFTVSVGSTGGSGGTAASGGRWFRDR